MAYQQKFQTPSEEEKRSRNLINQPSDDLTHVIPISSTCRRYSIHSEKTTNFFMPNRSIFIGTSNGPIVIIIIGIVIAVVILFFPNEPRRTVANGKLVPRDAEDFQPPSWSRLRIFKGRGAICSDEAPCAKIGKTILEKNGSAVDAAIAVMICNGLVSMQAMGIGGGFMMTIYKRKSQTSYFLVARDIAPLSSHPEMFHNQEKNASRRGPLSIAVPGEVAGYAEAHRKFGKLTWQEIFQPNVELCRRGWNLTKAIYDDMVEAEEVIMQDPTLRKIFVDAEMGKLKKPGSLVSPEKLCETLAIIQKKGAEELYNGSLGRVLIQDLQSRGSILTVKDLNRYRPVWKPALQTILADGTQVITPNLPSSGGLLSLILNIFDEFKFTAESIAGFNNTILTYHRMIEAWKFAFAMRSKMGDDLFVDMKEIVMNLTSKLFASSIKSQIDDERTCHNLKHYGTESLLNDDHGTAAITVLAPNGDAVSVTSSVNMYFGSGVVSERTGILMNSGMDDFAITSVTSHYGLPGTNKNNFIQPGKRAMSSMVPSILLFSNGDVRMVVGGAGGTKILTSTSFMIGRHLWMNNTIKQAMDAARIHHQLLPMKVSYEYGVPRSVLEGLQQLGHKMERYRDRGSIVCAVTQINEMIYANSDYRKSGDIDGIDEEHNFLVI